MVAPVFGTWVATCAMVYHWPPSEIEAMSVEKLAWYMTTIETALQQRDKANHGKA